MGHPTPAIVPGTKRNSLTIIRDDGVRVDGKSSRRRMALVRCDCGSELSIRSARFFSDTVRSCGCVTTAPRHGYTHHRLYPCWLSMVQRCTVPDHHNFPNYGGRGISVCERWLASPENFIADMSPSYSEGMTIERTDVDGNYEPANCRWATNLEQQRNRRNNFNLEFRGETKTISEWSAVVGLDRASIMDRLAKGWSVEKALTEPRRDRYGNPR